MNNTPELLSPAGDLDKMRFGIAYGADAVYMAGTRFGMRAAATNFDDNALREGIAYAHAHGVKCYITVNIMPSNRDLPALPAYLELLERLIQALKQDCHFGHLYFYRDRMLEARTRQRKYKRALEFEGEISSMVIKSGI